jgi:hypothetical protein
MIPLLGVYKRLNIGNFNMEIYIKSLIYGRWMWKISDVHRDFLPYLALLQHVQEMQKIDYLKK